MSILLSVIAGLLIGSFLNVVIVRLPAQLKHYWANGEQSTAPPGLVRPASHCPHCKTVIRWQDNIPVIGWLKRRGVCLHCQQTISLRYPFIELLTALSFGLIAWQMQGGMLLITSLLLTAWLIALAAIDYDHFLLPDCLTLSGLWLGLLYAVGPGSLAPAEAIIGAASGYLFLWTLNGIHQFITGHAGMGHGDFKLLAMIGAWLGPWLLPMVLMLAAGGGALLAITRIAQGKANRKDPMPFGPWLAGAGWIGLFFNESLTFFA